ncbi:hypothetical protein B0H11DRAFT_1934009 [Mycena galericulata]|nr:hypothetical protein B0H11DRAFT_1934009 [Mycena galericulata]
MAVTRTLPFSRPAKLRPMRTVRIVHLDPLNKWLAAADIDPSPDRWDYFPDNIPDNDEVICEVLVSVIQGILGTGYSLNLQAYDHGKFTPPIHLARYTGSLSDADAPLWARRLPPLKFVRLLQPRAFVAKLVAGMTDIPVQHWWSRDITPEMLSWARQCAIGTPAHRRLGRRCKNVALANIKTWERGKFLRGFLLFPPMAHYYPQKPLSHVLSSVPVSGDVQTKAPIEATEMNATTDPIIEGANNSTVIKTSDAPVDIEAEALVNNPAAIEDSIIEGANNSLVTETSDAPIDIEAEALVVNPAVKQLWDLQMQSTELLSGTITRRNFGRRGRLHAALPY